MAEPPRAAASAETSSCPWEYDRTNRNSAQMALIPAASPSMLSRKLTALTMPTIQPVVQHADEGQPRRANQDRAEFYDILRPALEQEQRQQKRTVDRQSAHQG